MLKVSQLIGMDIYTDSANQLGKVYDVIIDLQKGEIVRLTLEPIKATSKDEARKVFREKTILYSSVKAAATTKLSPAAWLCLTSESWVATNRQPETARLTAGR